LFLFEKFLLKNCRYTIDLANVIGLALTDIFNATGIFDIAGGNILLSVLLVSGTRSYISFTSSFYNITKGNGTTIDYIFR
jgi:hypothetical protein